MMRVSSYNFFRLGLIIVLCGFFVCRQSVAAQTRDDLNTIRDEIVAIQQKTSSIAERMQDVQERELMPIHEAVRLSFFTTNNISIWILWVILVMLLLLLFAIRRNIRDTSSPREVKKVSKPVDSERAPALVKNQKPSVEPESQQDHITHALVNPVKVVKIKVHKITKKNT